MIPSLIIKLRPTTPWRIGPDSGARDRVDSIYHSDSLYSAVTLAMGRFGWMEEWLAATALGETPEVRFGSCFPFVDDTLLVVPPRNLWPPPPSVRVRWKAARFVPMPLVANLLKDPETRVREDDGWTIDSESECLLPTRGSGRLRPPFRHSVRRTVAVDRFTGTTTDPLLSACTEFTDGAGLWFGVAFGSPENEERWIPRLKATLSYLADSGFGGERSRGWGRAENPEFVSGGLAQLRVPIAQLSVSPAENQPAEEQTAAPAPASEIAYWMLSLYSPATADQIDWQRGSYSLMTRGGRIDSSERAGEAKKLLRMVSEGSVICAAASPCGAAPDVAPDGFPHPVFRAGYAVGIPIVWRVAA